MTNGGGGGVVMMVAYYDVFVEAWLMMAVP